MEGLLSPMVLLQVIPQNFAKFAPNLSKLLREIRQLKKSSLPVIMEEIRIETSRTFCGKLLIFEVTYSYKLNIRYIMTSVNFYIKYNYLSTKKGV